MMFEVFHGRPQLKSGKYLCGYLSLLLIMGLFWLMVACGTGKGDSGELVVFAATSLTEALTEIEAAYENSVEVDLLFSFGGSQALARQIISGAPADVFISAGEGPVALLEEIGLVTPQSKQSLLSNELVVVVHPDVSGPAGLFDLKNDRFNRIAIADPNLAPAGVYAQEALLSAGVWDDLNSIGKIVFGTDVRVTLNYVRTGNSDAALVYATDALSTPGLQILDIVPKDSYPSIIYPATAIMGTSSPDEAMAFIDHLKSQQSVDTFRRNGFQPIP